MGEDDEAKPYLYRRDRRYENEGAFSSGLPTNKFTAAFIGFIVEDRELL
jgi:hypothetical protein